MVKAESAVNIFRFDEIGFSFCVLQFYFWIVFYCMFVWCNFIGNIVVKS
jgi:hypothetical protein